MITGIVRADGREFWIEYRYPLHDRPISVGTRWRVLNTRRTGPLAPDLVDGLSVSYSAERWQAYKDGAYLILDASRVGERLPDIPIPQPKVRKGTDLRYYDSRWEKYSKRDGWTAAT